MFSLNPGFIALYNLAVCNKSGAYIDPLYWVFMNSKIEFLEEPLLF